MKVLQRECASTNRKMKPKSATACWWENFKAGELVDVSGVSKGKGFAGGVKRWHYRGRRRNPRLDVFIVRRRHRGSSFPSRVWKNQHFPGHMGNANVTAKNLKVVKVDSDENLLLVRGSVPGPSGT